MSVVNIPGHFDLFKNPTDYSVSSLVFRESSYLFYISLLFIINRYGCCMGISLNINNGNSLWSGRVKHTKKRFLKSIATPFPSQQINSMV